MWMWIGTSCMAVPGSRQELLECFWIQTHPISVCDLHRLLFGRQNITIKHPPALNSQGHEELLSNELPHPPFLLTKKEQNVRFNCFPSATFTSYLDSKNSIMKTKKYYQPLRQAYTHMYGGRPVTQTSIYYVYSHIL